jgi:DNA polymerase-3 subunit gamma/tau
MLTMLVEIEPHFRRSSQQQLLLETTLVRFALLDRTLDLEAVLKGMGGGGAGAPPAFGGGGTSRAAEPTYAAPTRSAAPPMMRDSGDTTLRVAEPARSVVTEAPPPRAPQRPVAAPAPSAPARADVAAPAATLPAEINRLAEHWDDIVDAVRRSGRGTLASVLDHATPQAVAGNGTVTLAVDSEAHGDALTQASEHVLAALRTRFHGVERIAVKAQGAAPMVRLTEESVREGRVAQLRKRDPVLDAAIEALDLRMLD